MGVIPRLRLEGVSKRFGRLRALDRVCLEIAAGEVHAILGENGAGKSTLMNVVYGLRRPDAGRMEVDGRRLAPRSPIQARAAGIGMVHQELALVDAMTVVENLVPCLHERGLRLHRDRIATIARQRAAEIGLELPRLDARIGDLPIGVRQRIEIFKALARPVRVLILDEPTAVLTPPEIERLFSVLDHLRRSGTGIALITHKLDEVARIADRVTVLRRGQTVGTLARQEIETERLAEMMVGRQVPPHRHDGDRPLPGPPRLRVQGLRVEAGDGPPALDAITLEVGQREILGLAGVDGNGQWELFAALTGLVRAAAGCVYVDDYGLPPGHPDGAWRAGLASIPPERRRHGLVADMSVAENAILAAPILERLRTGILLSPRSARRFGGALVERYAIRAEDVDAPVSGLSGGNQQRLIVARALATEPRAIVAFNPTRGLDIAATEAVHAALRGVRAQGAAIVLISTDLEEILALSDRIAVLYRGRLSTPRKRPFPIAEIGALMAGREQAARRKT